MRRYKKVGFPAEAEAKIIAEGGKPVMAMVWVRNGDVAFMMVSDDPSGPCGEIERHLSVSSSTDGIMREPTEGEMVYAAEAIGWEWPECKVSRGSNCVHIYRDVTYA